MAIDEFQLDNRWLGPAVTVGRRGKPVNMSAVFLSASYLGGVSGVNPFFLAWCLHFLIYIIETTHLFFKIKLKTGEGKRMGSCPDRIL